MDSEIEYKFSKFASDIKLSGGNNLLEGGDLIQRGLPQKCPIFYGYFKIQIQSRQNWTTDHTKHTKQKKEREKTLQVLIKLFQSIKNTLLNEISMHKQHVHFLYLYI